MKTKTIIKLMAVAILASVFGLVGALFARPVSAAEEKPEFRLGITPTQNNLEAIKPGKTYSGTFDVRNTGKQTFKFKVSFVPYSVEGENYDVNYNRTTQYTEITNWITTDISGGSVEPGGSQSINYTITIPEDAHGGAQAGVIMVTMDIKEDEQQASGIEAIRQLGYLVFGNVDGDIIETANIVENKIPSFLFKAPIYAESVVENTGNVYSNAEYTLQVFPLFSDEEAYTTEEDPSKEVIFPETKRYNKVAWEGSPQLGIYRVRQTVKLFDQTSTEEKLVFICPLWFLFICVAVLFIILFSIIHRLRHHE